MKKKQTKYKLVRHIPSQSNYRPTEEALYQKNSYLASLHETALSLMNRLALDELLEDIVERACELMNTPHGFVYLVKPEQNMLEVKVGLGIYRKYIGVLREKGGAMSGKVWQTGQPLAIEDYLSWEGRACYEERPYGWNVIRSVMGVPLKSGSEIVGVIGLGFNKQRKFTEEDVHLLSRFAALASIALDNARLYQALQEELAERKNKEAELEQSLSLLSATLESTADGILTIDKEGKVTSYNKKFLEIWNLPKSIVESRTNQELRTLVQGQLKNSKEFLTKIKVYHDNPKLESFDLIEFKDGRIVERYTKPQIIGGTIVGRVFSFRDITERKQYEEKLKYLSLNDALTGLFNRAHLEQEMCRLEAENTPTGVIICDVDGLKLANDTLGHQVGDGLLLAAAGVIKNSVRQEDVVARIGGDEFAILLPNRDRNTVDRVCQRIKVSVANYNKANPQIALSISLGCAVNDNARSLKELFKEADNNMYRDKIKRKKNNRDIIVQNLIKAIETKDFFAQGHSERLIALVVKMAKAMGLANHSVTELRLLAKFHDIGKVGISDAILFKKAPLTPEETIEIQRHCEIGYRIAQSVLDLAPIAEGILKHHEWWNGKGYPLGLKGEEIPLECQILTIAEAYEVMTNDRPYRRAMEHREAVAELKKNAGSQFNPQLVTKFIQVLEEID